MKPDRNGPCPCGSDKKFKHCCIGLHNERIRWDGLEDRLRNKIDDYWKEYYDKYIEGAMYIYGNKDIQSCQDISERRLFFDWFIHDYIIPDKSDTVIRLFVREYEDKFVDELERNTAIVWSNSVFRFFDILDIKRGVGYKVRDIFNEDNNELFIYDKSSSETVKKYDIQYLRPYPIGNITRIAGGGILLSRSHLPHIKDYVLNNFQKLTKQHLGEQNSRIANYFDNYLRNESLSIIKYLESLTLTHTLVCLKLRSSSKTP
jgi:SEC-C motif